MLMQRGLFPISVQPMHFQGYPHICCSIYTSFCSLQRFLSLTLCACLISNVLDIKCSPIEPIFVSATSSKGCYLPDILFILILNNIIQINSSNKLFIYKKFYIIQRYLQYSFCYFADPFIQNNWYQFYIYI